MKKFNPKTVSSEAAFMARQLQQTRYCSLCGKPMLLCSTDENNHPNYNLKWEMDNGVHWSCFTDFMRKNENGGT